MKKKSDKVLAAEQATREALLPEHVDVFSEKTRIRQCKECGSLRVLLRLRHAGLHDAQHEWFCEDCTWRSEVFHQRDDWPEFVSFFRPAYEYRSFDVAHRCTTLRPPSPRSEEAYRTITEYHNLAQGRVAAAQALLTSATRDSKEHNVVDIVALVLAAIDQEMQ